MPKCKFKEMIKVKGTKHEVTGRRRSLPAQFGAFKKASERVLTRNLRRSIAGEASRSKDGECTRKRKKKLMYSPELSSGRVDNNSKRDARKVTLKDSRKAAGSDLKARRKRRRILEDTDDESDTKTACVKTADPEKCEETPLSLANESSADSGSEHNNLEQKSSGSGASSSFARTPFLMRKMKRESCVRTTTQKYETERTDYIKEDRPSFIETSKLYVCHDAMSSGSENSPKSELETDKSPTCKDEEVKSEQSWVSGKASRSRSDSTHRSCINFQVGGRLEARDYLNMWYPSRIMQVDSESREILIHFERWNSRFDEWVSMDSPRLRPITRISTRKDNRARRIPVPKEFKIGEIVYAKWTDCKMYPAKILKINPDVSYTVLFYDGFERDVQFINVKKLPPELVGKIMIKPGTMMKVQEEKHRRVSGSKSSDSGSIAEQGTTVASEKPIVVECQPKLKDVSSSGGLSSTKVTPGIAPNKRNKLLVGGIFQAKRQQLKIKIGGGAMTKMRKQSVDKSSSGRCTPNSGTKSEDFFTDKDVKPVTEEHKPKARGSISSPLLVQELNKAPLFEPTAVVGIPTKAFLIEEDHNHFKCTVPGCGKSFRKDVLLASHMKHYHTTPKAAAPVKKSASISEVKEEVIEHVSPVSEAVVTPETPVGDFGTPINPLLAAEGNLERKLITEKRRQLLMQRKLDSMTKKKEQHISDVIASVAKKFNQPSSPEKMSPEIVIKEVTPKIEKPKTSPKKRRYFFTTKVMSKFRRMKMVDSGQTGKITNGRRISALDDGPHEELINCCCARPEEDGLMMQCEVCLAWQHGPCFGIEDEKKVPDKYICHACKNPKGLRSSFRYCYNQDWFKSGEMASFKFLPPRDTWNLRNNVYKTHGLAAQTLVVNDVLHSLRCKLMLTKNSSHLDLRRWSRPWTNSKVECSLSDNLEAEDGGEKSAGGLWGFSDHCYSVPNQEFSSDSLVDQNGLFFNEGGKGLCFDVAANEEVLDVDGTSQAEEAAAAPLTEQKRVPTSSASLENGAALSTKLGSNQTPANSKDDGAAKHVGSDIVVKSEPLSPKSAVDHARNQVQNCEESVNEETKDNIKDSESVENDPLRWQLNLLDHIENVQQELDVRLDEISQRLEVLEAEYEYSDVNVSKDPYTEMPRTKRLLNCVINDLLKVRRMALYR